jgi:hypothetical protein
MDVIGLLTMLHIVPGEGPPGRRFIPKLAAFAVVVLLTAGNAAAQTDPARNATQGNEPGSVIVRATAAAGQIYLDETFPDHAEFGGSVRVFVSRRIAVQAEVLHFHSNVSSLPNEFTYSLYASALRVFGSLERTVRPYVVGGITARSGGIGNTAKWPYGGVGFQFLSGRRLSADLEVGGPLLRVSGSVGYRWR